MMVEMLVTLFIMFRTFFVIFKLRDVLVQSQ